MANEAQGRERQPYRHKAASLARGRVAEALQAPPGALKTRDPCQQPSSRTILPPSRCLHRLHLRKDVRRQVKPCPQRRLDLDVVDTGESSKRRHKSISSAKDIRALMCGQMILVQEKTGVLRSEQPFPKRRRSYKSVTQQKSEDTFGHFCRLFRHTTQAHE